MSCRTRVNFAAAAAAAGGGGGGGVKEIVAAESNLYNENTHDTKQMEEAAAGD